ncbi:Tn3 family transposase [Streptomyces platensis]|uniref:Tn3 family transposase n=1 Tax=Streptomyces TaxID=1883 RepID=UPI0025B35A1B|nr:MULTISPECIES: Tn3 family transposase [Streptomyces]WJY38466.1 Tn3 family transposase [Streptomyces sp. P9-2B-2]WTI52384.1 Tn3 family transposase [Streptomyces platensis]WUB81981.1 Tn3 family transposase [Streptomyces platensis]
MPWSSEKVFKAKVRTTLRSSYSSYYRQMLPPLLKTLGFRCNNTAYRPAMDALALLEKYAEVDGKTRFYDAGDTVPTGPDKEHAEASMLALHLLQSALVHVNTLLLQQVLAEPAWAKKLTDEDRRGLTALFWSNINPYGTFRLEMDKQLDLGLPAAVPRPRSTGARTVSTASLA